MKKISKFKSENAERDFWAEADSTEYVDWKKAKRAVLSELKPSQKTISLRLPEMMILNGVGQRRVNDIMRKSYQMIPRKGAVLSGKK